MSCIGDGVVLPLIGILCISVQVVIDLIHHAARNGQYRGTDYFPAVLANLFLPDLLQGFFCCPDVIQNRLMHPDPIIVKVYNHVAMRCQKHIGEDLTLFIVVCALPSIDGNGGKQVMATICAVFHCGAPNIIVSDF